MVRSLLATAMAVVCWLCAGCMSDPPVPLRIGIMQWPGAEYLYLAQQQSLFAAAGGDVRIVEFGSGADVNRAFERGVIDGFLATPADVLQAYDHSGRRSQMVLVTDVSEGCDVILARRGISTVAALRGQRVGLEIASINTFLLARALERSGMSLADVSMLPLHQRDLPAAMADGVIDAAVTYEPFATEIRRTQEATQIFSSAEIPSEVIDGIAIDSRLVTTRAADIDALRAGYAAAHELAARDPANAIRIMAEREGLQPSEFQAALDSGIRTIGLAEQAAFLGPHGVLPARFAATERVLRAAGQLGHPIPDEPLVAPVTEARTR